MRNDFGLGGRARRGEGAAGTTDVPSGGEERTCFFWSLLCWLSWGGQVSASRAISSTACMFLFCNGDKPLQRTHILSGWCHLIKHHQARTISAGRASLIPAYFCCCP